MNTPSAVPEDQKCPQCGAALPAGALAGLCPACLLKQGAAGDTMPPVAFVPPSLEELARLFPQLEILALIGTGGMGAVYKARQKELDRVVALKILPPGAGDSPAFADRFTREAKALARLNHPGIVTIHDTGRVDGLYYFLMEFVDGVNLRQLLKTGRLAPREALAIVPQICDALQYAHDAGIVHRDIKPENILLDRQGRVKVADFGLAKLVGTVEPPAAGVAATQSETTKAGQIMGTPQYMAPEQRERPSEVDHRADIYSLGVVFYQMLTGELPGKQLEPPSSRMRGIVIDVRLDEVVLRALEKQPARRYQQANEVKTIVETIATTPSPAIPPAAPVETGGSPVREQPSVTPPRFSRTAMVGAVFSAFFLVVLVLHLKGRWMPGLILRSSVRWGGFIATTVIGWMAVLQIRRAAGNLRGLSLAVFEGLLFPLLALDGALFFLCYSVSVTILGIINTRHNPWPLVIAAIVSSLVADWLIAYLVWRKVRTSGHVPIPKALRLSRRTGVWLTGAILIAGGLLAFFLAQSRLVSGRVLLPDGTPVTDAIVYVATTQRHLSLGSDGISHISDVVCVKTIPGGEFWIRAPKEQYALAIWHEKGFAEVSVDQLKKSPTVVLQPWGRVTGTVRIGGKLLVNEPMVLSGGLNLGDYRQHNKMYYDDSTRTDARGEFSFDRVPPVLISGRGQLEVGREVKVVRERTEIDYIDHTVAVQVSPGQTMHVAIGGTGRPVVGRIALPPGEKRDLGSLFVTGHCYPYPLVRNPSKFVVLVQKDGTFRVEDVPGGTYEILIELRKLNYGPSWGEGGLVGTVLEHFNVPESPNELFDLGTLTAQPVSEGGR